MSEALANLRSLGTYEVVRKLGAGGMAEVFLAVQRMAGDVERLVVVKSILPLLAEDQRFVQMFLREARLAALLTHPNIVHIHDVAVIDKRPCIVMEFLRGRDVAFLLKRLAGRNAAVEPVAAAALIAQAASGLDYAHQKRDERGRPMSIVHRDVSPHNLFVTRDGHVRVLDFGIAKSARQREHTETGTLKGKLAYMAPEYLKGQPIDGRADEFALGVVLWEALTGQRLFHRAEHFQTMEALFSMNVAPPSSVLPSVPKELDAITMRALSREPEGRFGTCEEMAASLRDFLRARGAQSEAQIVAQWIEQVAPVREDAELYGANPSGATTTYARGELEAEPIVLSAPEEGVDELSIAEAATRALARPGASPPTKTVAPPEGTGPVGTYDALTHLLAGGSGGSGAGSSATLSRTDRIAGRRPAQRPLLLVGAAGGAVVIASVVAGAVWLARGTATPSVPALTAAPSAPAQIEVRFQNVPDGTRIEVDGLAVVGARLATAPSPRSRHVQVWRGSEVLVAFDEVLDQTMSIAVPAPDVVTPSVAAAPPVRPAGTKRSRPRADDAPPRGRAPRLGNGLLGLPDP